jgi:TolB-like protein/DNA-binding winged helix-turn-helix (wHTH) protein
MLEAPQHSGRRSFGVFEMDLRAGELRKRGLQVRLQEQPFQVLVMLLEHPGEVVTREELQNKLWPADTFVDFDHGLNKAINKIRDALGDSAESPRFVETVARREYRFLAEVRTVDATPARSSEPPVEAPSQAKDREPARLSDEAAREKRLAVPLAWGISVLVLLLLILTAWTFHSRNRTSPPIRSLAVLPLESLSGDASQDYFADGMTDELITDLGQISALRVISRTSVMPYKGARKPLAQIARELSVDAVVEGTVLREGNRVRITAHLIEAPADNHLWDHDYQGDLGDTLALQNQVARAIAGFEEWIESCLFAGHGNCHGICSPRR